MNLIAPFISHGRGESSISPLQRENRRRECPHLFGMTRQIEIRAGCLLGFSKNE
jgi:hypothetical protein